MRPKAAGTSSLVQISSPISASFLRAARASVIMISVLGLNRFSSTTGSSGGSSLPAARASSWDVGASVPLYVCATTKVVGAATNVTGGVSTVTAFPGTGFAVAGGDTSAQLTVNP